MITSVRPFYVKFSPDQAARVAQMGGSVGVGIPYPVLAMEATEDYTTVLIPDANDVLIQVNINHCLFCR